MAKASIRDELHALLDRLPEEEVSAVRDFLRSRVDSVEAALQMAPLDDEPLSLHERNALAQAQRRAERGDPLIPHDEVLREFGIEKP